MDVVKNCATLKERPSHDGLSSGYGLKCPRSGRRRQQAALFAAIAKPTKPDEASIIAQVEGSGTVGPPPMVPPATLRRQIEFDCVSSSDPFVRVPGDV